MKAAIKHLGLQAEEISCAGCAIDMETVLENTDGILDASVDYATGIISIEYDPAEIDAKMVIAAAKRTGIKIKRV